MKEFTGNYYKCNNCGAIYDFNDICPECGNSNVEDINENEIIEVAVNSIPEFGNGNTKMITYHDDYSEVLPSIDVDIYLSKLIKKASRTWKGIDSEKWLSEHRGH